MARNSYRSTHRDFDYEDRSERQFHFSTVPEPQSYPRRGGMSRGGRGNGPANLFHHAVESVSHRGDSKPSAPARSSGILSRLDRPPQYSRNDRNPTYQRPGPTSAPRNGRRSGMCDVIVSGYSGQTKNLISLIQKQTDPNRPFIIIDGYSENEKHVIRVRDYGQAAGITKCCRSLSDRGKKLEFNIVDTEEVADESMDDKLQQDLCELLNTRFKSDQNALDLSKLTSNELCSRKLNTVLSNIVNIIKNHLPNLASLSLAGNQLYSLQGLQRLAVAAPDLKILDLSDNRLSNLRDLESIQGLAKLNVLNLENNPLTKDAKYRSDVINRLPSLTVLDGVDLPTAVSFGLNVADGQSTNLPQKKDLYYDASSQEFVGNFIQSYFSMFDSQRFRLTTLYDETNSVFSLSVIPPQNPDVSLNTYVEHARNICNSKTASTHGVTVLSFNILAVLNKLPAMRHLTETFCVEAWNDNDVMYINVHGQFIETTSEVKREFDRIFVLIPSPVGSLAQKNGIPAIIINDHLNVRPCAAKPGLPAIEVGNRTTSMEASYKSTSKPAVLKFDISQHMKTPLVQFALQNGNANGINTENMETGDNKQQILDELRRQTNLNEKYAIQCLEQSTWNLQEALRLFHAHKDNLGAEAYN